MCFTERHCTCTIYGILFWHSLPRKRESPAALLQSKQRLLALDSSGVAGQRAVCAQHAVAGYDDRDGVMSHRAADGLCAAGHIERVRQRAIGRRCAVWDVQKLLPDLLAKRRSEGAQRKRTGIWTATLEIRVHPPDSLPQKRGIGIFRPLALQRRKFVFLPPETTGRSARPPARPAQSRPATSDAKAFQSW